MNNPIRVAVVDDNLEDRERLVAFLAKYKEENPGFSYEVEVFDAVFPFVDKYSKRFDAIFMDIDFHHASEGFTAIEEIRKVDMDTNVIFVTNMAKFAVKGYEVAAFDFVVKPIVYNVFTMKMSRLLGNLSSKRSRDVTIGGGGSKVRVNTEKLLYVEVEKHKITYHTVDGLMQTYDSMKHVEESLSDPLFVKCNNCYLVNLRFVDTLDGDYVYVGKDKLLISSPRKAAFKKELAKFICGGK